jgi:peroxiredoxin
MARIPVLLGLGLTLFSVALVLPACQSRQNAEEKRAGKTTSWRATPQIPIEEEESPSITSQNTGKVEKPPNQLQQPPRLPQTEEHPTPSPTLKPPKVQPSPPPETIPKVALSEELRATCLVKVGDVFPEGQLTDLSGKTQSLAEFYGKRLTVIFFWSIGKTEYTRETMDVALRDLQLDVLNRRQAEGLNVIGVNVGDPADDVKVQIEKMGVKFPVFLDPQGTFFHQVATQELPRIYLLNAAGNILWFDIDFTYISRQNLAEAIHVVLQQKPD